MLQEIFVVRRVLHRVGLPPSSRLFRAHSRSDSSLLRLRVGNTLLQVPPYPSSIPSASVVRPRRRVLPPPSPTSKQNSRIECRSDQVPYGQVKFVLDGRFAPLDCQTKPPHIRLHNVRQPPSIQLYSSTSPPACALTTRVLDFCGMSRD
jgi:hypothetical protein